MVHIVIKNSNFFCVLVIMYLVAYSCMYTYSCILCSYNIFQTMGGTFSGKDQDCTAGIYGLAGTQIVNNTA